MRRLALPLLSCLLGMSSQITLAQTQTRPHMDLVRGLRNERLPGLALEYLNSLKWDQLDAETKAIKDVEYARTWLELASEESEEAKRSALIGQAKRQLESFITANPKHPVAAQANADLAKLYLVQGKSMIRKAKRQEDEKKREEELKLARPPLLEAAKRYKAAAATMDAQVKQGEKGGSLSDKTRRELVDFRMSAQLDEGITLYYLAETYAGQETADLTERGNKFKEAKKLFERIRYEDEKLPIRWVAMAWSAQADLAAGDAHGSERTVADMMAKKGEPAAAAGMRVARFFAIVNNWDAPNRDFSKLDKECAEWLRDFASQRDSSEGVGVRYYLARARMNLGSGGLIYDKKDNKLIGVTPTGKARLEQAQLLFKELADGETEYSERASQFRSQILVTLADAEGHGDAPPLQALQSFERAVLMAQVQIARFANFRNGAGKSPPPEDAVKKEEKFRFTRAIQYLEHALTIAGPKDNARDVFAARWLLVSCYYQMHMYPQAAVLAEYLARENPKMPNAPKAGSAAVAMYNQSRSDLRKLKEKIPETKDEAQRKQLEKFYQEGAESDLEHVRRAANYMVKQWPKDSLTDESRHILAEQAFFNKQYRDALKTYLEINNSYSAVQRARLELASVMQVIVYPDEKDPAKFKQAKEERLKEYEKEWKQTVNLLENIPMPDENSPLAAAYLNNRAQLARLYLLSDNNTAAVKVGEAIVKEADRFKLDAAEKTGFKQVGRALQYSGMRAQAIPEFKSGNHAKVAEILDPVVKDISKDFGNTANEEVTQQSDRLRRTEREVVMLALQSAVQDGKIDRAGELLDLLEKSGGSAEESLGLLQSLVSSVRTQLDEIEAALQKAGADPKRKKEVEDKKKEAQTLKEGFAKLLEKIANRGDKLPIKMKLFLAMGLSSVGAHDQAIAELEKVRKAPAPQIQAKAGDDEEAAKKAMDDYQRYQHQAQFLMAKVYRQKQDYPKSLAIFREMIGETSSKGPTPKEKQGWAYASLQVRKEKAQMLEEMATAAGDADQVKRWGEAVQEWVGIVRTFAPSLTPLKKPLPPQDHARKILYTIAKTPREDGEENFCVLEYAWWAMLFGPTLSSDVEKAAEEAKSIAIKRERYFDLFFEQKRCSVQAFKHLKTKATKGDPQALQSKFAGFAKDFADLQSPKNPDLPQSIKERIKELVESVEDLKKEYAPYGVK